METRNLWATLAGFVVAGAILLGLGSLVGLEQVVAALAEARLGLVLLVGIAILAWFCLWGAALWTVLAAVGETVSIVEAVLVHAGAAFSNNVTPFGQAGGEPVAAWLISDVSGSPYERSLAAMTSFDTINVVPSLCFALLGLSAFGLDPIAGEHIQTLAIGVAGLALGLPMLLALSWRYRRGIERRLVGIIVPLAHGFSRLLPRVGPIQAASVRERIEGFVASIERIATDRRRLAIAVTFSAGGWAAQAAGLWLAFEALGATIPPYVPLFVVPLATIAGALPTPGGRGGIETVQVSLLALATSVPAATVAAAVTVFSVGGFLFTTAIGAAAVAVLQVREGKLREL